MHHNLCESRLFDQRPLRVEPLPMLLDQLPVTAEVLEVRPDLPSSGAVRASIRVAGCPRPPGTALGPCSGFQMTRSDTTSRTGIVAFLAVSPSALDAFGLPFLRA